MSTVKYFPNLNGLRCIAACMVLVHHLEQLGGMMGYNSWYENPAVKNMGKLGVALFFVLSGFLITRLLLDEEKENGKLRIKDFYLRRILRIWPLYYIIVLPSLLILPSLHWLDIPGYTSSSTGFDLGIKLFLYVLLLPNLVNVMYSPIPFSSQAWSIGVEEQFYLVWPWLLKFFKKRLVIFVSIIAFYLLVKLVLYFKVHETSGIKQIVHDFWFTFHIDLMAIGGLFALLSVSEKHKLKEFFFSFNVQIAGWLITIVAMVLGVNFGFFHYEIYGILFGVIIFNGACNPRSLVSLEWKPIAYLGRISYGIYMYHLLCIAISAKLLQQLNVQYKPLYYLVSTALTIVVASLSYKFIERPFLQLKRKYHTLSTDVETVSTAPAN